MSDLDPRDERRLRDLLDEAVADVEPRDARAAIRNRTKVTSMQSRRPWILASGGAVLATAATVTAFAVFVNSDGADPEDPGFAGTPSQSASPDPTDEPVDPSTTETFAAPVYYVGDTAKGPRLYREWHEVAVGDDRAVSALAEMMSAVPFDPDYRSVWSGTGAEPLSVSQTDGDITVDVTGAPTDRPGGVSEAEAAMAIEQLIYTVQGTLQAGRSAPVRILLDGQPSATLFGVNAGEGLAAGDPLATESLIQVSTPLDGAEVTSPFTVEGRGSSFEATVEWELLDGDTIVEDGFTTAEGWLDRLYPFSFEVAAPPGEYTLVVKASDPSGGEGGAPDQDTKQVTVAE